MSWESKLLLPFTSLRRVQSRRPLLVRYACLLSIGLLCYGCSSSGPVRTGYQGAELTRDGEAGEVVPESVRQSYDTALEAMLSDDITEAELALETIVLEYPDYAGPYANLAILYLEDGRDAEARVALDAALSVNPEHAESNNQLGILLRKEGRFIEAEKAYRRAIQADAAYSLAHYNLGVLLDLYLHRPAEALDHYEAYQALLAEPDTKVARWIIDLRRRVAAGDGEARVAQGDGA